jgi:hypothetical protein
MVTQKSKCYFISINNTRHCGTVGEVMMFYHEIIQEIAFWVQLQVKPFYENIQKSPQGCPEFITQ